MTPEPWWRSAVFYHVDPLTFQDADGDGRGDLPGLLSRLDYIQTLGVDALILDPVSLPSTAPATSSDLDLSPLDQPGFDDLISETSRRHIRVVVVLPVTGSSATLLARARLAFTRGAAGIELAPPSPTSTATSDRQVTASALLPLLRSLAAAFPGERVILSDFGPPTGTPHPVRSRDTAPELVALSANSLPGSDVAAQAALLRTLVSAIDALPAGTAPLLHDDRSPADTLNVAASTGSQPFPLALLAIRLLTLRGAVSVHAGQELGLPFGPSLTGEIATTPLMQWTPANITPATVKIEPNSEPANQPEVYGAYHPYVKPVPKPTTLSGAPPPPPDPNSLPGFTTGILLTSTSATFDTAHRNVAVEDNDPHSLLNLYRRLIALHHGHATLRSGATAVLTPNALTPGANHTLIWVRRSPTNARTVASVVVACNLSDTPLSLNLDTDLAHLRITAGRLRPLLAGTTETNGPQSTNHLTLAPYSLYIGEISRR